MDNLLFTEPQELTLIVSDANDCQDTTLVLVDVISAVGDAVSDQNFNIFPNPVLDQLTILNVKNVDLVIQVSNHLGQSIVQLRKAHGDEVMHIPTETWSPGLYYIKIDTAERSSAYQVVKL